MALFQELHAEGVTFLIVTHESEISRYAERIVELRDGRVTRDIPVHDRHEAPKDTSAFLSAEPAGVA